VAAWINDADSATAAWVDDAVRAPGTTSADDTAEEIEDDMEYYGPFQCTACQTVIPLRYTHMLGAEGRFS